MYATNKGIKNMKIHFSVWNNSLHTIRECSSGIGIMGSVINNLTSNDSWNVKYYYSKQMNKFSDLMVVSLELVFAKITSMDN